MLGSMSIFLSSMLSTFDAPVLSFFIEDVAWTSALSLSRSLSISSSSCLPRTAQGRLRQL